MGHRAGDVRAAGVVGNAPALLRRLLSLHPERAVAIAIVLDHHGVKGRAVGEHLLLARLVGLRDGLVDVVAAEGRAEIRQVLHQQVGLRVGTAGGTEGSHRVADGAVQTVEEHVDDGALPRAGSDRTVRAHGDAHGKRTAGSTEGRRGKPAGAPDAVGDLGATDHVGDGPSLLCALGGLEDEGVRLGAIVLEQHVVDSGAACTDRLPLGLVGAGGSLVDAVGLIRGIRFPLASDQQVRLLAHDAAGRRRLRAGQAGTEEPPAFAQSAGRGQRASAGDQQEHGSQTAEASESLHRLFLLLDMRVAGECSSWERRAAVGAVRRSAWVRRDPCHGRSHTSTGCAPLSMGKTRGTSAPVARVATVSGGRRPAGSPAV